MDLASEESAFPHLYQPEKEPAMKLYFTEYANDCELEKLRLSEIRKNGNSSNGKTAMSDMFLVKIKLLSTGVCMVILNNISLLINSVTVVLVYSTSHMKICREKLSCPNCTGATVSSERSNSSWSQSKICGAECSFVFD